VRAEALNDFVVGVALVGVPVAAFAPEVVRIVGGPSYLPAARVVPVLVLAFLIFATMPITQIAMMVTSRTRRLAAPSLLAAGLNVVGCLVLCPRFGIAGAAWATVIGFAFQAIVYYVVAQRTDHVPYPIGHTVLFFVLVLPVLVLGWWMPSALVVAVVAKGAALVVLAAVVVGLRIVDRHRLVAFVRGLRPSPSAAIR
jgi:O-antigen/teichoic acid export membrane protein